MIVPRPAKLAKNTGEFLVEPSTRISTDTDHAGVQRIAHLLARDIHKNHGISLDVVESSNGIEGEIRLEIDTELETLGEEGYRLVVQPQGVVVQAAHPRGLFYGTQSLRQLVDTHVVEDGCATLPCVDIEDQPRFPWRGYMLDSSRHMQSVEFIKSLIDTLAYLKLNVLHWHFTDYHAWRPEILKYPRLTEIGSKRGPDEPGGSGFYTQDDMRDLVAYAHERFVMIMPEIETPAHASAAMVCYPELTCSGKPIEIGAPGLGWFHDSGLAIFCPSRPETFEFLENVLNEIMDIFDAPVIHVGGDERPDGIWSECERCQGRIRNEGLSGEAELQHVFMEQVSNIVRARGRRTMAWMPTVEFGVPEGQIAQDWYHNVLPDATRQGIDVLSNLDRFTYLDYPNFPGRQMPEWMHIMPLEKVYSFEPTPPGLTPEQEKHVIGSEACLWTEFVQQEDVDIATFPRILAFAEVMWTPAARRNWDDFQARCFDLEAPIRRQGFRYASRELEQTFQPKLPATVDTSMTPAEGYPAEAGFDGRFTRFFWSQEPPKSGDHFTVHLDQAVSPLRICVYTGSDIVRDDWLRAGVLEVSEDGEDFQVLSEIRQPVADVMSSGKSVKAIRIRVTEDQQQRLAVREIVLA